jgi:acetyl esterase/lipase
MRMLAAVALLGVSGSVQGQADPHPPIHYQVPGMADVRVVRDLRYKSTVVNGRPNTPLALDVYLPSAAAGQRNPALVFVHGGLVAGQPPGAKEWTSYKSWGRLAAASGMVGVVLDHRMSTRDNVDEAGADLTDAIAFVRSHAAEYSLDPDRICVAFYSAGGPISSVMLREQLPYLRCVILYYPFLDLDHLRQPTPFRGPHPSEHADSLMAYSPRLWLFRGAALPPIFLARAGRDQIPFLNESVARFMTVALATNAPVDFVIHPTGSHGFDTRDDDARTRDIIGQTIRFARRHLGLERP